MVIDAAGAEQKGRGQAAMTITAQLAPAAGGTKVSMEQDLQLSGAAAQYGRGMIQDVTAVLMGQFASNMQQRIGALERGESLDGVGTASASGLAIGLQAAQHGPDAGLPPVLPPLPTRPRLRSRHGPVVDRQHRALLVVVSPVLVALLNRVLAALERIRGASDDILRRRRPLAGELDGVPEALATTDATVAAVATGAARYGGSVGQAAARPRGGRPMPLVAW